MLSQILVLASTSPYRRALLSRLKLEFIVDSPQVDETPLAQEIPADLVLRLSIAKARSLAEKYPQALIIGSDQVVCLGEQIFGKPGNRENAISQLKQLAGQAVLVQTGLCLLDTRNDQIQALIEPFWVHLRPLTSHQIEGYLDREQPYDCAGSVKAEGLGSALFTQLIGADPTALIGLPLIRLVNLLENAGVFPLGA